MSLLEEIHSRHQNFHRVIRHNAIIASVPNKPVTNPIKPELYYKYMWFGDLLDITPKRKARPTNMVLEIRNATAKYYGLTQMDMICHRRTKELVRPRQVAMYIARLLTPFSLPAIARHFGNRDHTTALHACRTIERKMKVDAKLSQDIAKITAKFPRGNT